MCPPDNSTTDLLPPDYDAIERGLWRENASEVANELRSGDDRILKRLQTYIDRFGYEEGAVRTRILSDEMFAAHFAKEPRRQGIHESIAAEWLRQLQMISEFEVLPKSGARSLHVSSDATIIQGDGVSAPGKSLDFKWKCGSVTCYAMHKYTKEGGGNQDSQFKEMVELLRRFQSCRTRRIALFVIVDGPYYTARRMDELLSHVRDREPKSFALSIGDVPTILQTPYFVGTTA